MIVKKGPFCIERGYVRATMDRYWRDALAKNTSITRSETIVRCKKGPFVSSVDTYAQLWTSIGVMAFVKYVRYAQ